MQLHEFKHTGPGQVVAEVQRLVAAQPESADVATHLAYLKQRAARMQSPSFLAAGWPIGDGAVESGHKLVVKARLKGRGMHWARPHVDPMLALRNIVCSDRWDEAWPQIVGTLRQQVQQRHITQSNRRMSIIDFGVDTALEDAGRSFESEPYIPVALAEGTVVKGQCPDLVVERLVFVELKAHIYTLSRDEEAQVIGYFATLPECPVALYLNFGRPRLEYRRLFPPTAKP